MQADHHRGIAACGVCLHRRERGCAEHRVEGGDRLVEQVHRARRHEHARQANALPFAAGQTVTAQPQLVFQAKRFERGVRLAHVGLGGRGQQRAQRGPGARTCEAGGEHGVDDALPRR